MAGAMKSQSLGDTCSGTETFDMITGCLFSQQLKYLPCIFSYSFLLFFNNFFRIFILPGLWLQRLTTREPDESQLEVALVALKML